MSSFEARSSALTVFINDRPNSAVSTIPSADDNIETPLSPGSPSSKSGFHKVAWRWIQGPVPPLDVTFEPLLPEIQRLPTELLRRGPFKAKRWRFGLLLLFWFLWLTVFAAVVHNSQFRSEVAGIKPYTLSCGASLWYLVLLFASKNNGCGEDGSACQPFSNSSMPFRCPAQCASTQVLNPWTVGQQTVIYQPFVIGGPTNNTSSPGVDHAVYRADSFICGSAIHAGLISNRYGGCGVFSMIGENHNFPSSTNNGISSFGFDAGFPSSFTFLPDVPTSHCSDLRWGLLAISVVFTTLLSLTTTSPLILTASVFTGVFFHVAMGSDPPSSSNPYGLVSLALSRFLPASFVVFVLYTHILKHTLSLTPSAQIERTILWLGALWVGALTNITIEPHIPISRLTGRDLRQQPGAITALVVLIVVLTTMVAFQAHYFRLEGRLPGFLALYAGFGAALGLAAAIPGSSLRIHHYILALLLLPGTKLRTRVSLVCSGLLLGLFINGVARWGFAGIVETPASLRGDGLYYSSVPTLLVPEVGARNATFAWTAGQTGGWEIGVSVMVNDVERFRVDGLDGEVTWNRTESWGGEGWEKVYVRVGWYGYGVAGDYTKAGVLEADGTWVEPMVGRSR